MLFVYIYLFPFLEKLRTNIFLNFETMIEKFEKMFLRTSSNSVDKKGMGDERYERGIKCLTDKFDNRIGRVTRYIGGSGRIRSNRSKYGFNQPQDRT